MERETGSWFQTRNYGHGRGSAHVNVARDSVDIHLSQYRKKHNPWVARSSNPLHIRLQRYLLEFSVPIFHLLDITFVEIVILWIEVVQPAIQLPENVVQPLDEICPVVSQPDSTEILPNGGTCLAKIAGNIPLRPDKKQV